MPPEHREVDLELEEQFILRLPINEAGNIKKILNTKPEKIKRILKIDLDVAKCIGTVYIGKKKLSAYLRTFPTIIESYKTNILNDKTNTYKTADICHIVECYEYPLDCFNKDLFHGYTPPLKNVKKRRFRKTLVNPELIEENESISKELYFLLKTDVEAVSTKYEIIYEDSKYGTFANETLFGQTTSSDSDIEVDI
ncbi:transcription initiation factor TFIID subunit 7-like isoform X2 [Sitophilus oryzae]|uniref:Transcription initiation factor TFIID subunit 7-like isoform X2 n=1 Tax=Sitophilus oryzae TaxID=7048 RepID=A0A6J2XIH7_SITOR|nr:transcription initiation factor TFIID subunit 7-like isoform X2 [Sitophilus oryzae]